MGRPQPPLVMLSIPGLRAGDLERMPRLMGRCAGAAPVPLTASFPAVTWPVQANMLTGCLPSEHGIVANGLYDRQGKGPRMWTLGNGAIERPQVWDVIASRRQGDRPKTASWFPMLARDCGADIVCMPAPIHNPDGSESLWCYSKPTMLYGTLRDGLGHFPLHQFWGPMAGIGSTQWIARSMVLAAKSHRPDFAYIYLPHLDYAAQKLGPDSPAALDAVVALDATIGEMLDGFEAAHAQPVAVLAVSEYVITAVDHVCYPNRILRELGLLKVIPDDAGGEQLDFAGSAAWALVDHQFSHVFVRDRDPQVIDAIAKRMRQEAGIAEVWGAAELAREGMGHARSGELVLVSTENSWQAYYWWLDDARAPAYARTVDIHRKPGYDPVELHVDMATKSIPLDATRIRGSHGAPVRSASQRGVAIGSIPGWLDGLSTSAIRDVDVFSKLVAYFFDQ
jgi:hypothetical protein